MKTIASLIYYLYMNVIHEMMTEYQIENDTKGNDIYSKQLIPSSKLLIFLMSKDQE